MNPEGKLKEKVLTSGNIPQHIAIIMDGNGRWAKSKHLPRIAGHREGINSVREITKACGELGVNVLTLFTFSRENWFRPITEVSALMNLLVRTIRSEIDDLMRNNVRLHIIGHLENLPDRSRIEMEKARERTKGNTGLNLILALNYGGRVEILDAVKKLCTDIEKGVIKSSEISEKTMNRYLQTAPFPEPDILIRTSGENRISNFLLWQIAYTEIYFTPVYWPAFRRRELYEAILDFQARERRYGRLSEQVKGERK